MPGFASSSRDKKSLFCDVEGLPPLLSPLAVAYAPARTTWRWRGKARVKVVP
jgi:hypothetical protein